MNAIETRLLTRRYGKHTGIDGLSLAVQEGSFFGFIGPNGAGKSTTIRTLLGYLQPDSGEAQVLGRDIRKDHVEILSLVGYLPSEAVFWHGMRGRDVFRLSRELRGCTCQQEAERLCQRLQLDPSRRVDQLSLGNRKKVAIVCALQHCPPLLILDEPTSGLDPLMQREFFQILQERHRAGATIFLSSHILSEVQHHCSQAAILRQGRLIAQGTVVELTRTGARRVKFRGTIPEEQLSRLDGIRDLHRWEDGMEFFCEGDCRTLLSVLAGSDIRDLTITEPDLEEVFLHCYSEGRRDPDGHPEA